MPSKLAAFFARLLSRRHGGLLVFLVLFVGVAQLSRLALLLQARSAVSWNAGLLAAAAIGLVFDLAAGLLWAAPLWLLLTFAPARAFAGRLGRGLAHVLFVAILYALPRWLFAGAILPFTIAMACAWRARGLCMEAARRWAREPPAPAGEGFSGSV